MTSNRDRAMMIFNQVDGVSSLYEVWAKKHGIRYNVFLLYYYLLDSSGKTQSEFSDELELPRQTVNSMVKKLEEEGMVELVLTPLSKKEKTLRLTEQGRAFAKSLVEPLYTIESQAGAIFTDEEYELLSQLLSKFSGQMESQMMTYLEEKHDKN